MISSFIFFPVGLYRVPCAAIFFWLIFSPSVPLFLSPISDFSFCTCSSESLLFQHTPVHDWTCAARQIKYLISHLCEQCALYMLCKNLQEGHGSDKMRLLSLSITKKHCTSKCLVLLIEVLPFSASRIVLLLFYVCTLSRHTNTSWGFHLA